MLLEDIEAAWLAHVSWQDVVYANHQICAYGNAEHGITSDGYELVRTDWEEKHRVFMRLSDACDLCRLAHRRQPFLFFNGNTFAAVIRDAVSPALFGLNSKDQHRVREVVVGFVAGTVWFEELRQVIHLDR